jgi:dUTP pyrophosphatase
MSKYTLFVMFSEGLPKNVKNYYLEYKTQHKDDCGFDLPSTESIQLENSDLSDPIKTINFKIKCAMINNETQTCVGYYLYPRSSISKYPLFFCNNVGIIDPGYRGEIKAKVRYMPYDNINENYKNINELDRIFQICSPDLSPFNIEIVVSLPDSSRGDGGFGSTGK